MIDREPGCPNTIKFRAQLIKGSDFCGLRRKSAGDNNGTFYMGIDPYGNRCTYPTTREGIFDLLKDRRLDRTPYGSRRTHLTIPEIFDFLEGMKDRRLNRVRF